MRKKYPQLMFFIAVLMEVESFSERCFFPGSLLSRQDTKNH